MIKLYRDQSKFKDVEIIVDNESFFIDKVCAGMLNSTALKVMYSIDKAILLDANLGTIQTPYGITSIDSLSTGCKTVINYIVIANNNKYANIKAINATECGWNAIEELFKTIEITGYDIGIIIEHENNLFKCAAREYVVDDNEIIQSLYDF